MSDGLKRVYRFSVAHPHKNASWTGSGYVKTIETGVCENAMHSGLGTTQVWVGFHTTVSNKAHERAVAGLPYTKSYTLSRFEKWGSYPTNMRLTIEDAERLAAGLMLAIAEAREVTP